MRKETSNTAGNNSGATNHDKPTSGIDESFYQRNLYVVMTLNMTWQLAVVVIVPVVAGKYLDGYFNTAPMLLIAGGIIAFLGVIGVMMRIVKEANRRTSTENKSSGDKK